MITTTTKRDRIMAAPRAYHEAYQKHYGTPFLSGGVDPYETTLKLRKLNLATCGEEDVAAAIGNSSWTDLTCDLCGVDSPLLVNLIGEYEQFSICSGCLDEAAQAMSAGTAKTPQAAEGDSPPARSEGCARKDPA